MPAAHHPWDRLHDETNPAYAAFRLYLEQGAERSLANVARALSKSKPLMVRWSGRHQWVLRAHAYDEHLAQARDAAAVATVEQRGVRQAEIAMLHGEALAVPARELLTRLRQDPELLRKLEAKELLHAATQAARAYPGAMKSERLARGMDLPGSDPDELAAARERIDGMDDGQLDAFLHGVDAGRRAERAGLGDEDGEGAAADGP